MVGISFFFFNLEETHQFFGYLYFVNFQFNSCTLMLSRYLLCMYVCLFVCLYLCFFPLPFLPSHYSFSKVLIALNKQRAILVLALQF